MSAEPYEFQPYDVLQVERNGRWLDYMTLRTPEEGEKAVAIVRGGGFRITRYKLGYGHAPVLS